MKMSESVRSTHNQDGAVVLDILNGKMYRLNFVGSRILELLNSGLAESQIINVLSREFSAEPNTVARDLNQFLALLRHHQLIRVMDAEPGVTASGQVT